MTKAKPRTQFGQGIQRPLKQSVKSLYVVCSRGPIMVVLSPEKEIKGIHFFRKSINGQPEGLAFDSNGTMYLSNESHGKSAHISVYTMQEIETENDSVPENPLEELIKGNISTGN